MHATSVHNHLIPCLKLNFIAKMLLSTNWEHNYRVAIVRRIAILFYFYVYPGFGPNANISPIITIRAHLARYMNESTLIDKNCWNSVSRGTTIIIRCRESYNLHPAASVGARKGLNPHIKGNVKSFTQARKCCQQSVFGDDSKGFPTVGKGILLKFQCQP